MKQCLEVEQNVSFFQNLKKGAPRGSTLSSVMFNIILNEIFIFFNKSTLYNYADDNTVSYADNDPVN